MFIPISPPIPSLPCFFPQLLSHILQLDSVQTFPPSDSHIFPEYILPALSHFPGEEAEEIVRVAFAGSLAQLAETAKR